MDWRNRIGLYGSYFLGMSGIGFTLPFLPLYLLWTVSLQPLAEPQKGQIDPSVLTTQYQLDESSIDLLAKGTPPLMTATDAISLSGSVLLSARAAGPLIKQITDYVDESNNEDPALSQLAADIKGWPLLSQAVGGLNELLLGCEAGLQVVAAT